MRLIKNKNILKQREEIIETLQKVIDNDGKIYFENNYIKKNNKIMDKVFKDLKEVSDKIIKQKKNKIIDWKDVREEMIKKGDYFIDLNNRLKPFDKN